MRDFEAREGFLNLDGDPVRISVRGSGRPIMLLNGVGARLGLLDHLRTALAGYTTITLDMPGTGESPVSERLIPPVARLHHYANVVLRALDSLAVTGQTHLLGVSWGGALAQHLAFQNQDRFDKLILVSTAPMPWVLTSPGVYAAFFRPGRNASPEQFLRTAATLYGGLLRKEPGRFAELARHFEPVGAAGRLRQLAAVVGWTSLPYLWRIRAPALVMTGSDDPLVPAYNSDVLRRLIPGATLRVLCGEGHLLVATSASVAAAHMREFIGE